MSLDNRLLEILACPSCKGDLVYFEAHERLLCRACPLLFRVDDDIPVMLVDEAESLDAAALDAWEEQARALGLL